MAARMVTRLLTASAVALDTLFMGLILRKKEAIGLGGERGLLDDRREWFVTKCSWNGLMRWRRGACYFGVISVANNIAAPCGSHEMQVDLQGLSYHNRNRDISQ